MKGTYIVTSGWAYRGGSQISIRKNYRKSSFYAITRRNSWGTRHTAISDFRFQIEDFRFWLGAPSESNRSS